MAKWPLCGEGTPPGAAGMSPLAAAQQADIAAVTQFDGFLDPAADALAFAAFNPFGGIEVADFAVDQRRGQFPATGARMMPVEHLQEGKQVLASER